MLKYVLLSLLLYDVGDNHSPTPTSTTSTSTWTIWPQSHGLGDLRPRLAVDTLPQLKQRGCLEPQPEMMP
jgi:hypothetical protein